MVRYTIEFNKILKRIEQLLGGEKERGREEGGDASLLCYIRRDTASFFSYLPLFLNMLDLSKLRCLYSSKC